MTRSGTQRAYAQSVGTTATNYPIIETRDPNAFDVNYSIGQQWQNTANESLWYLNSQSSLGAILQSDWINIESSIATLSDTADTPVSASSGTAIPPNNIQLINLDGSMSILSDPANHRIIFGLTGGSEAIDSIAVQTGTSPVVPTIAGLVTINGAVVAAGTHPVRTDGTGPNTLAVEVQTSQAIASTNATNIGLSAFNSTFFTVDANGFVSVSGTGLGQTITGNTGGALSPTAGNWNIFGASTAAGTSPVITSGTGSTLNVNVQKSQAIASTNASNVGLAAFNSLEFTVDANGFVSLSGASGFNWSDKSTSFLAVSNNGYFCTATLTATLPAAPNNGDEISIYVDAVATITITANTGQTLHVGSVTSASAGTAVNTLAGDAMTFVYRSTNTQWVALNFVGNWVVT